MTPGETAPFPWDEVLGLAFASLRWSPDQVWRATPREIAFALGLGRGPGPLPRQALAALMRAFPDHDPEKWEPVFREDHDQSMR